VVTSAGAVPDLGGFNGVHDLPLPLVIVVPVLLSEGAFVGAERGEEGDENDVGEKRVQDAFGKGIGAVLGRGDEVACDPVLGAVLFDERVLGVRGDLSRPQLRLNSHLCNSE